MLPLMYEHKDVLRLCCTGSRWFCSAFKLHNVCTKWPDAARCCPLLPGGSSWTVNLDTPEPERAAAQRAADHGALMRNTLDLSST